MSVERYNARAAEIHWQRIWDERNVFGVRNDSEPGTGPYLFGPLRVGHVRVCAMGDVIARYKRATGFDVLRPKTSDTPGPVPDDRAIRTLKSMGLSVGWSDDITDFHVGGPRHRQVAGHPGLEESFDPDEVIETYGADAVRWFALSDSPPDRNLVWTEAGLRSAWRFVQRLWCVVNNAAAFSQDAQTANPAVFSESALTVRRIAHRALAQVSGNIERLRFNVAVAHIYELARALQAIASNTPKPASPDLKFAAREAVVVLVQLFYPMMPHLAEECWAALGREALLATCRWPELDMALLAEKTLTLPVYVNARKRADVTVARDARNGDIEASALRLDAVRRALDGKAPRKVIIVPQRIINVVA